MLYVDLDDFKDVNDTLGHAAGDRVLVEVARRLVAAAGPQTLVARLGGDEFAVLVRGDATVAMDVTTRVLDQLAPPVVLETGPVRVRTSIGLAARRSGASAEPQQLSDDAAALLVNADVALYAAKQQGKARSVAYDPRLGEAVRRRAAVDEALRAAVRSEAFDVVYQPVVDVRTGDVVSAEALLRWPGHDTGPAEFVPRLEALGLISDVGRWVLRTSCATAAEWAARGLAWSVAVNVSPLQLVDATFEDDVRAALADTGLSATRLVLEVTESAATEDVAVQVLERLRDRGVTVAVDDFGTGFSSLSRLITLPTGVLKVDRSLVHDIARARRSQHLVRAVIELAHSLGLVVVAEGVEEPAQLDALRRLGCDRVQGMLTGPPGPADAVGAPALLESAAVPVPRASDATARV